MEITLHVYSHPTHRDQPGGFNGPCTSGLRDFASQVRSVFVPLVLAHVCDQIWLHGPISSTRKNGGGLFRGSELRIQKTEVLLQEINRRGIRVPCLDRKSLELCLLRDMQKLDFLENCSVAWNEIGSLRETILLETTRCDAFEQLIAPCLRLHEKSRSLHEPLDDLRGTIEVHAVLSFLEVIAQGLQTDVSKGVVPVPRSDPGIV